MGDDTFTRGRVVPFVMAGPAVVWSESNFSNVGGSKKTSTDVGVVVELGLEYFVVPQLSIGPSFRYRHVFGPTFSDQGIKLDSKSGPVYGPGSSGLPLLTGGGLIKLLQ